MADDLGRLERVDLREQWESEPADFTPWLGSEENIKLLGDTIGMELEVHSTEKGVGSYRADILCKETATDRWVLIENQLEKTDHRHMGQLMTYAAGLNAFSIVSIAARFTDEHRAALDWLNEITGNEISFFGLEVELWRIGESPCAPKFNVVAKPNDWVRAIHAKQDRSEAFSDTQQAIFAYWGSFKEFLEDSNSSFRIGMPSTGHWRNFPIGRRNFALVAALNTRAPKRLFCYLAVAGPDAKAHFHLLSEARSEIDAEMEESLEWRLMPNKKESQIHLPEWRTDPTDESMWPEQHAWLRERLEKLHRVFAPRVKELDAANYTGE